MPAPIRKGTIKEYGADDNAVSRGDQNLRRRMHMERQKTVVVGGVTDSYGTTAADVPRAKGFAGYRVKLTERSETDDRLYAWQLARNTDAAFEVVPGGRQGKLDPLNEPAIDTRLEGDRFDLTDKYVFVVPGKLKQTAGGEIKVWEIIDYPESAGTHHFTQDTMVTDTQKGYDFNKIHSVLNES
jgi:hypothetical protein